VGFLKVLFSKTGLLIVVYVVIGFVVAGSTFPPHSAVDGATAHAWIQFFITLFLWPLRLAFPHTTFHF
jgi:succinate dehydrogenase hydrophobic anchor subunit